MAGKQGCNEKNLLGKVAKIYEVLESGDYAMSVVTCGVVSDLLDIAVKVLEAKY